jgi:hypothetical protein
MEAKWDLFMAGAHYVNAGQGPSPSVSFHNRCLMLVFNDLMINDLQDLTFIVLVNYHNPG